MNFEHVYNLPVSSLEKVIVRPLWATIAMRILAKSTMRPFCHKSMRTITFTAARSICFEILHAEVGLSDAMIGSHIPTQPPISLLSPRQSLRIQPTTPSQIDILRGVRFATSPRSAHTPFKLCKHPRGRQIQHQPGRKKSLERRSKSARQYHFLKSATSSPLRCLS